MPDEEKQIRILIEQWAEAVRRGDMNGFLVNHSDDIVMFDVPPPHEGVRGIGAYRETWPPFFEWQAQGASSEMVSLDVTAGADASGDVAYARALLRCGTPQELAKPPENRLRLTIGLRKEQGRWVVAHKHRSFPRTSGRTPLLPGGKYAERSSAPPKGPHADLTAPLHRLPRHQTPRRRLRLRRGRGAAARLRSS
jgi:uncharacterized protein (TIGR02246 family)